MAKTKKLKKTRVMQIRLSESEADLIYSKARKKCTTLTNLVLKAVDKY